MNRQRVKKIILTGKILSKKIDDGLTPRHFFTVHNGNGNKSNAYKRSLTGRGNQGLMWGEGYINPPRGPNKEMSTKCFKSLSWLSYTLEQWC